MKVFKRISYFILTNILVVLTISLIIGFATRFLGLNLGGGGYAGLFIICLIWGFVGSFISLQLSRWMAKKFHGVKLIDTQTMNQTERKLIDKVYQLARNAGMKIMPEVGYYEAPDVNAFATGPSKKRSLVAVSTGLMQQMNDAEIEGVLAHEIAHIVNGDMVTLALIQGIINSFAMFFAHIITTAVMSALRRNDDERSGFGDFMLRQMIYTTASVALTLLGSIVVCYFSRQREFRADAGGARLASTEKMAAALRKLQSLHLLTEGPATRANDIEDADLRTTNDKFAAFKISGKKKSGLTALFSTHPPLEERLSALANKTYAASM